MFGLLMTRTHQERVGGVPPTQPATYHSPDNCETEREMYSYNEILHRLVAKQQKPWFILYARADAAFLISEVGSAGTIRRWEDDEGAGKNVRRGKDRAGERWEWKDESSPTEADATGRWISAAAFKNWTKTLWKERHQPVTHLFLLHFYEMSHRLFESSSIASLAALGLFFFFSP